ncbi:hypothetical protein ECDEC12A_5621 [Escherichia coli DEC12A]|nr:hypothetical protein ECDEC12A_5621 [Escherichia coli DEC12A]
MPKARRRAIWLTLYLIDGSYSILRLQIAAFFVQIWCQNGVEVAPKQRRIGVVNVLVYIWY